MTSIYQAAPHRFDALIFGGDDYALTVGATRMVQGLPNSTLLAVTFCCKPSRLGVSCIDIMQFDFHDIAHANPLISAMSEKRVIHPNQIDPVQKACYKRSSPFFEAKNTSQPLITY